jgi:hypothetical protein
MDPVEFYLLAQRLLTNEPNAAGFRTAISRAYQAAFLMAVAFLGRMGVVVRRDANGHQDAVYVLNNAGDADLAAAATVLGDLRDHRNQADYRLDNINPETHPFASLRVQEASDVLTALAACRADPTGFSAAMANARTYARSILGLSLIPPSP